MGKSCYSLLMVLATLAFSLSAALTQTLKPLFHPLQVLYFRGLCTFLGFSWIMIGLQKKAPLPNRECLIPALLRCVSGLLSLGCLYLALQFLPLTEAVVLHSLNPVWTTLYSFCSPCCSRRTNSSSPGSETCIKFSCRKLVATFLFLLGAAIMSFGSLLLDYDDDPTSLVEMNSLDPSSKTISSTSTSLSTISSVGEAVNSMTTVNQPDGGSTVLIWLGRSVAVLGSLCAALAILSAKALKKAATGGGGDEGNLSWAAQGWWQALGVVCLTPVSSLLVDFRTILEESAVGGEEAPSSYYSLMLPVVGILGLIAQSLVGLAVNKGVNSSTLGVLFNLDIVFSLLWQQFLVQVDPVQWYQLAGSGVCIGASILSSVECSNDTATTTTTAQDKDRRKDRIGEQIPPAEKPSADTADASTSRSVPRRTRIVEGLDCDEEYDIAPDLHRYSVPDGPERDRSVAHSSATVNNRSVEERETDVDGDVTVIPLVVVLPTAHAYPEAQADPYRQLSPKDNCAERDKTTSGNESRCFHPLEPPFNG